jgi:hypothetical protein
LDCGVIVFFSIPITCILAQAVVFGVQLLWISAVNGMIIESKWVAGLEYFVIQDHTGNAYDAGTCANLHSVIANEYQRGWPSLRPGPVTDKYCEDMLAWHGLDLRESIVT